MKLRCLPDDFHVEELAQPEIGRGEFALYRLSKRSLGTPEAVGAICRHWKLSREHVAFGGLKDRHAFTEQYVTIWRGPRRNLAETNVRLVYLGQTPRKFESSDIDANRFEIVLRDLSAEAADNAIAAFHSAARDGLPNYFDDQRFGSVGVSGEFVAQAWCRGDFERTLWLAIAEDNVHDRPRDREEKALLRERWGNWSLLAEEMNDELRRAVAGYLNLRPRDFRTALTRLSVENRRMYLAAFQSHLWNEILSATLRSIVPASNLVEAQIGTAAVVFYRNVEPALKARLDSLALPLPTAREKLEGDPRKPLYETIAGRYGLEVRTLRVKYPRDSFFSRGDRNAAYTPENFAAAVGTDELHAPRRKLTLRFVLSRGSYATILVKRILLDCGPAAG